MLGMIDLGVFKGFVNKELDDGEIIRILFRSGWPQTSYSMLLPANSMR